MQLRLVAELPAVAFGEQREMLVMASLVAPKWKATIRAPLDLVTVIDRSGSMTGQKMDLVKETLSCAVPSLQAADQFSVVAFGENAALVFPLTLQDAAGKEGALRAIASITAGGGTNLSGGFSEGLRAVRERKHSNQVAGVMIFTDGQANTGCTTTSGIVAQITGGAADPHRNPLPCTLDTFGYGSDHNPTLLKKIAEVGNGMFYFVENARQIEETFASCIGGLLSVCAQNIVFTIRALAPARIVKVHSGFAVRELEVCGQSPQTATVLSPFGQ